VTSNRIHSLLIDHIILETIIESIYTRVIITTISTKTRYCIILYSLLSQYRILRSTSIMVGHPKRPSYILTNISFAALSFNALT